MKVGKMLIVSLLSATTGIMVLAGCGTTAAAPATPSPAAVQTAIAQRVEAYYNSAFNDKTMPTYQITAGQLDAALKTNPSNFFLMDVRKPNNTVNYGITSYGYNDEHIPGAVSIPYGPAVATAIANNQIPKDKTIVTICYTGQWANQTAAMLRLLGYKAYALHLSMSAWNQLTDVIPGINKVPNYPLVAGSAPGTFSP